MKHLLLTTIAALVLVGCGRQELLQWKFEKEFYAAVKNNDREAVKKAVADSRIRPYQMQNALRYAADKGQNVVVKILIASGTDINSSTYGLTPLMFAVSNGHKEITKLLINKGADINTTTRYTKRTFDQGVETLQFNGKQEKATTALDQALASQHTEVADLLRKNGGKIGEELKAEGK